MNTYKQLIANISILTFMLSAGVSTAYASSDEYQVDDEAGFEKRCTVLATFDDNNYEDWKKILTNQGGLSAYISKEQFEEFVNIRNLARNGNYQEALARSTDLRKLLQDSVLTAMNQGADKAKWVAFDNFENRLNVLEEEINKSM